MADSIDYQHIRVERDGAITRVTLARPEVLNAFGALLIEEIGDVFLRLHRDRQTRAVVLAGDGRCFSAGADANWMRDSVGYTRQQNVDDATRLALMLDAIAGCDKPVVCKVHGLAIGGGLGIVSAADYVVSADSTMFAFSEVKLGLVPAVISPWVLNRIGPGAARALFVTGERFDARRAERIGLVHSCVTEERLDEEVDRVVGELLTAGPEAIAITKHLVNDVMFHTPRDAMARTVETIASKRTDPEAQEGLGAFLDKRRPSWMSPDHDPAWV